MTEGDSIVHNFESLDHPLGECRSVFYLQSHHSGVIRHLPLSQWMLGRRGKPWIEDAFHAFVAFEIFRDRDRRLLMRLHANWQSCRATQDEPGIEGREHAAEMNRCFEIEGIELV